MSESKQAKSIYFTNTQDSAKIQPTLLDIGEGERSCPFLLTGWPFLPLFGPSICGLALPSAGWPFHLGICPFLLGVWPFSLGPDPSFSMVGLSFSGFDPSYSRFGPFLFRLVLPSGCLALSSVSWPFLPRCWPFLLKEFGPSLSLPRKHFQIQIFLKTKNKRNMLLSVKVNSGIARRIYPKSPALIETFSFRTDGGCALRSGVM